MMTGASPLEHGILDFTRRNPGDAARWSRSPAASGACRRSGTWPPTAGRASPSSASGPPMPAEPVHGLAGGGPLLLLHLDATDEAAPRRRLSAAEQEAWARETLAETEARGGL